MNNVNQTNIESNKKKKKLRITMVITFLISFVYILLYILPIWYVDYQTAYDWGSTHNTYPEDVNYMIFHYESEDERNQRIEDFVNEKYYSIYDHPYMFIDLGFINQNFLNLMTLLFKIALFGVGVSVCVFIMSFRGTGYKILSLVFTFLYFFHIYFTFFFKVDLSELPMYGCPNSKNIAKLNVKKNRICR